MTDKKPEAKLSDDWSSFTKGAIDVFEKAEATECIKEFCKHVYMQLACPITNHTQVSEKDFVEAIHEFLCGGLYDVGFEDGYNSAWEQIENDDDECNDCVCKVCAPPSECVPSHSPMSDAEKKKLMN